MRPSISRREARLIYAGAGALMLAILATVALAAGPASLSSAAPTQRRSVSLWDSATLPTATI